MEVNMEYFDVVDKNRVQLNYKKKRGEKLEENEFIVKCKKCGKMRRNKVAKDDNMDLIIKLSAKQY